MFGRLFLCLLLLLPVIAFAYTSVIAKPVDQSVVLPIADSKKPQEFFGRLDGFPHTFEFIVYEKQSFKAALSVPDMAVQKNDLSIIVVKEERRGVSEAGRTRVQEQSWESVRDRMLVESFKQGGALAFELEPGKYRLEVSSPNNEGKYRLVLGTEKIKRGYLANIRVLFEVKSFLDTSRFGAIKSPLLYVPVLILLAISAFFIQRRRKNKSV